MREKELFSSILFDTSTNLIDTQTKETSHVDKLFKKDSEFKKYIFPENELTEEQKTYLELLEEKEWQNGGSQWNAGMVCGMEVMKAIYALIENPRKAFDSLFSISKFVECNSDVIEKTQFLESYIERLQQEQEQEQPKQKSKITVSLSD